MTSLVASHQNGLSLRFCRTLSFTGFYGAILGFELDLNGLNWAFSRLYLFFGGVTGFFWILLAFTGFYGLIFVFLLDLNGFCWGGGFLGFCFFTYFFGSVTEFYWISMGFTGFPKILFRYLGFYWVLRRVFGF